MSWLTKAMADLLYAGLEHLHDERYSLVDHDHDVAYAAISHAHAGEYAPMDLVTNRQAYTPMIREMAGDWNNGLTWTSIGSGTQAALSSVDHHPGIRRISSHATVANSGYGFILGTTPLMGGEHVEFVFRYPVNYGGGAKMGFINNVGSADGNGAVCEVSNGTFRGRSSSLTTGTSYSINNTDWYRCSIEFSISKALTTYKLFSAAGAELWTDTMSNTGINNDIGALAYKSTGGVAALLDLDWFGVWNIGALTR